VAILLLPKKRKPRSVFLPSPHCTLASHCTLTSPHFVCEMLPCVCIIYSNLRQMIISSPHLLYLNFRSRIRSRLPALTAMPYLDMSHRTDFERGSRSSIALARHTRASKDYAAAGSFLVAVGRHGSQGFAWVCDSKRRSLVAVDSSPPISAACPMEESKASISNPCPAKFILASIVAAPSSCPNMIRPIKSGLSF
jgi:hypothetical protein